MRGLSPNVDSAYHFPQYYPLLALFLIEIQVSSLPDTSRLQFSNHLLHSGLFSKVGFCANTHRSAASSRP